MTDYAYANEPHGHRALPGLGRALDRRFLDTVGWRAVRARGELLRQMLCAEIACRGGEIRILDVASGPGRYLLDLLAEEQPGGQLRVFCRDLAPAGLKRGRRMALQRSLPEGSVCFEKGDAFDPAPLPGGAPPDIIVVSGLYELTPDHDTVRGSLERLHGMLAPDGVLLFTTQIRCPEPELVSPLLPWPTTCRSVEDAEAWAEKAGFRADGVRSRREEVGLFTVTRCGRAG
jgi:SAM-dependent methyltransferase